MDTKLLHAEEAKAKTSTDPRFDKQTQLPRQ